MMHQRDSRLYVWILGGVMFAMVYTLLNSKIKHAKSILIAQQSGGHLFLAVLSSPPG